MSTVAFSLAALAVIGLAIPSTRSVGLIAAVALAVLYPFTAAALAALAAGVLFYLKRKTPTHELSRLRDLGD